jgi:hypothetical protein
MRRRLKRRVTVEIALGLVSLALSILTLINKEWIEELTGLELDAGSGAFEWAIVLGFATAALVLGALAWRDTRRLQAATA